MDRQLLLKIDKNIQELRVQTMELEAFVKKAVKELKNSVEEFKLPEANVVIVERDAKTGKFKRLEIETNDTKEGE
jgi:hypothetical protein